MGRLPDVIVCPVCENQQAQGLECDVCGKDLSTLGPAAGLADLGGLGDLAGLGPPPLGVDQVPGLEVTIPDRVGEVPLEADPDLEANLVKKVGEVPVERMPDLETAADRVGDVPVERMPDLADERAPDDGVRTPEVTGAVTCRYCRNVQASGMICDKCGMKLPRAPGGAAAAKPEKEKPAAGTVRCRYCGAPNPSEGERCLECGRPLPVPD